MKENAHALLFRNQISSKPRNIRITKIYKYSWHQRKKYEIREKINNRYATDPEFYKRIREVAKQSYYRGREISKPSPVAVQKIVTETEPKIPKHRGRPQKVIDNPQDADTVKRPVGRPATIKFDDVSTQSETYFILFYLF